MSASVSEQVLAKFTTFGDLLRFLRRRAGLTQLELSIAVGYSDAQISRLEQNLRPPDIPTIQARFVPALGLENEPQAVEQLLVLAAHMRREDVPGPGLAPYKGLSYFEERDADLFVGREALTARLVERIVSLASGRPAARQRFLAIVGASGSGKSSLLHAGLVPALRWNKAAMDLQIETLTPTAHPLESLALALTRAQERVSAITNLVDDLAADPRSLGVFIRRRLGAKSGSRVLLVVDQFEELFALCRSDQERSAFIDNLLVAASESGGFTVVVVALRADFYAHCANYPGLREALAGSQEYIGAMDEAELRRAVEEPAHRGRWELEPGLVDLILRDVGQEPGALPLLSHALLETWQRRRGRLMTLSGYTSSGGVRGAIAETAEAVFADRFTPSQKEMARRIFLRLTELGDLTSTGDTRRRASFDELILKPEDTGETHALLKLLADARLVVTSEETVEVAHEALIREWPRLRGWLEDNREGLRLHRQLTEAAQEWAALGREQEGLYRGARLSQAQEWSVSHQEEMNQLECEFLEASIALAQQEAAEREAQRQRELETAQKLARSENQRAEEQADAARQLTQRARYLAFAFVLALLMAFTALFFGSRARQVAVAAQNDRRIALARELAASSLNSLSVDPERGILLALQSVGTTRSVDGTVLPESEEALHASIVSSPLRMSLAGHNAWVFGVAFSPDGERFASIGSDGGIMVWNAADGKELLRIPGDTLPGDFRTAQRIAYSPDGRLLAACEANAVKIYDALDGSLKQTLSGHTAEIEAMAFSPDGKTIATGSFDGEVRIWEVAGGKTLFTLPAHTQPIESLAFSPDGKWLATGGDDRALRIWDAATGDLLQTYDGLPDLVDGIAFSPDGTQLAFNNGDGLQIWSIVPGAIDSLAAAANRAALTIPDALYVVFNRDGSRIAGASGSAAKVWDAHTGRELIDLVGHIDWVMGLAFSPDGERLVTTSLDGTVKVWSLTVGQEELAFSGQGSRVLYSPDGTQLATDAPNGDVTLWDVASGKAIIKLSGHKAPVLGLAFSPDGKRLATASADMTAIVWDVATGKKLLTLVGHENGVRDIAFSPDGTRIATASFDGTAGIWDAATGKQLLKITGHNGIVIGVAFSPDGSRLATSGSDPAARLWDVATGRLLFSLEGHTQGIRDITYSPDGNRIATASGDGTAKVWDAGTGRELLTLTGHRAGIFSVAFSPDGKFLATGSSDNTAKIWDGQTGQELLTLPGYLGEVTAVAFSPQDGSAHLAVAGGGVVRVFLLRIDDLLKLAQSRVTRSLTTDECKRYLHLSACP